MCLWAASLRRLNGFAPNSVVKVFRQLTPSRPLQESPRPSFASRCQFLHSSFANNEAAESSSRFSPTAQSDWLEQATNRIVETPQGSLLPCGKYHEATSLFRAWSHRSKSNPQAPHRMESLLWRLLEELRDSRGTKTDVSLPELFHKVLDAWTCAAIFRTLNDPVEASSRARQLLVVLQEQFEQHQHQQDLPQQEWAPDRESFEVVLKLVCRVEGPRIARRVLAWMEHLAKSGKNVAAQPCLADYQLVLDAYAHGGAGHSHQHLRHQQQQASGTSSVNDGVLAESLLRHMISVGVTPDTLCYNLAMKAWLGRSAKYKGRQTAEQIQSLLESMVAPPDVVTYGTAIAAWAASGMKAHAVERAERLLREMQDKHGLEPNTVVYNAVLSAWVKARLPNAADRTAELIRLMEEASLSGAPCAPDLVSYNTHLHALSYQASSQNPDAARRAQELLDRLERQYDDGTGSIAAPNLFSYNVLIDAYCRSQQGLQAALALRQLLQRGIEPDTFSFNQVLTALTKPTSGSSKLAADPTYNATVHTAEQLLWYMDRSHRSGLHADARPVSQSFAVVLAGHAKLGNAHRAQHILDVMKDRAAHGEDWLKPTRFCYNSVISAWAASSHGLLGARKAESLLQEMEECGDSSLSPTIFTYNAVLNAWARSGTRCCGAKAETYLKRMWDLYHAGNVHVKPNDFSYNTVRASEKGGGDASSPASIIFLSCRAFVPFIALNFPFFSQVINAISKSKNEGKAQRALRLLRRMDKLYQAGNKEARPNEITYTAVLNSCAFPARLDPRTRRKALDTAIFTLEELRSSRYGQPNQITYGTFLLACANLLPEDDDAARRDIIERAFQQCCQDGQVGEMVLSHLRKAAPADLYGELLSDFVQSGARISVQDLPPEWRCNLRDKDKWRRPSSGAAPSGQRRRTSRPLEGRPKKNTHKAP